MKLDAEPKYDYSEHASKVISDSNKQFPSDVLKLDGQGEKKNVMLDAIEGKGYQSIDLSQSRNGLNAYYLSGKAVPINNCKKESDCRDAPCNATSKISLIAQEDLFYMDKTVTDVDLPHLSVSTNASTVKDICIDEGVQTFEKILVEHDKVDRDILERDVGDKEVSSPSKCATYLNETIDKTVKNDLRSFLDNGYPAEQCYSGSSIGERRDLDTTEMTACTLPSEEIILKRSHFLEEFNTDFPQMDSSSHNDGTAENQALRQKFNQVAEEGGDLTTMVASFPEEIKENKRIAGTISSNKDLFEEEKTTAFFVTSADTESNMIDDTKGPSDDVKLHDADSTSYLEAGDTSIVGNENTAINIQQSVQSQNGVGTEEPISDETTSARNSFSHLTHGDSNMLGPANFSGTITTSSHIPYSGSISLRSESSTTSAQSFAFPVLHPEWSSSPVRMAKADRTHLRKHRWRRVIICCKF